MKLKRTLILSLLVLAPLALFMGCGHTNAPTTAASGSNVMVTVPLTDIHGKTFSGAKVNVLYSLSSAAGQPVTGLAGTINAGTGTTFSFDVPVGTGGTYNFVAVQLNDANTNQTIAIGAVSFSGVTSVPVTLGPVNKAVYQVTLGAGQAFAFETDLVSNVGVAPTATPSLDIYCKTTSTGFELDTLTNGAANVAYLGNGTFMNFLKAPTGGFSLSSTTAKASQTNTDVVPGDVFCVKLASGYAWLQATSVTGSGIFFQYRVNTTLPYCGYEQTTADLANPNSDSPTSTPTVSVAAVTISGGVTISGSSPFDIAIAGNGAAATIFIPNYSTGTVGAYSASNLNTALFQVSVASPVGLAVDPSGANLYVISAGASVVDQFAIGASSFTLNGTVGAGTIVSAPDTTAQANNGALAQPRYAAFDNSGDLYITDPGTGGVADVMEYLVPSTNWLSALTSVIYWGGSLSTGTTSNGVGQVASAGTTLLVADSANNRIGYYEVGAPGVSYGNLTNDKNPAGALAFNGPQGVAYSALTNQIYISDTGNNRVVVMTLSGTFVQSITGLGLNGPTGLKLDNAQPPNLYVADTGNNRVLKLQ